MSTKIEWCSETWNVVSGCTKISTGCAHCYSERMTARLKAMGQKKYAAGFDVVKVHPSVLADPLRWRKPRTVFPCSMADLFHPDVPFEFVAAAFGVMATTPHHDYRVLTKRAGRMLEFYQWLGNHCSAESGTLPRDVVHYFAREEVDEIVKRAGRWPPPGSEWPLPNVWLGVTAENQETADERIPLLLQCPAVVRWVSVEPMVGPIRLDSIQPEPLVWINALRGLAHVDGMNEPGLAKGKLDWVIVGGESGPGARPMGVAWPRSLRDQCAEAGVPFLFKQHGEWLAEYRPGSEVELATLADNQMVSGGAPEGMHTLFTRVGKKAAGRELDGVIHDGYPEVER